MKIGNVKSKVATKVAKAKVKAKTKAKSKVASKCKGGRCAPVLLAALCALAALSGCRMGEQPTAQRAQTASTYTRFYVYDGGNATFNFGAEFVSQAQANETSGTEAFTSSPTSTPTVDVKPDIDVAYNDAIKNATDASKDVLGKLTETGAQAVLRLMASRETGVVTAETSDGGTMLVECRDGQCSRVAQ